MGGCVLDHPRTVCAHRSRVPELIWTHVHFRAPNGPGGTILRIPSERISAISKEVGPHPNFFPGFPIPCPNFWPGRPNRSPHQVTIVRVKNVKRNRNRKVHKAG